MQSLHINTRMRGIQTIVAKWSYILINEKDLIIPSNSKLSSTIAPLPTLRNPKVGCAWTYKKSLIGACESISKFLSLLWIHQTDIHPQICIQNESHSAFSRSINSKCRMVLNWAKVMKTKRNWQSMTCVSHSMDNPKNEER